MGRLRGNDFQRRMSSGRCSCGQGDRSKVQRRHEQKGVDQLTRPVLDGRNVRFLARDVEGICNSRKGGTKVDSNEQAVI